MLRKISILFLLAILLLAATSVSATSDWGFSDGLTVVGEYPERVYVDKKGKVVARYEVGSEF